MNKKLTLITLLVFYSAVTMATSGMFDNAISIEIDGSSTTEYHFGTHCSHTNDGCTGSNGSTSSDFNNANLGTDVNSIKIKWAEIRTFQNGTDNIPKSTLYYRVYPSGGNPSYSDYAITTSSVIPGGNSGDLRWTVNLDIELTTGLIGATAYTLEIYSTADFTYSGGSGIHYNTNSALNFKASFTTSIALPVSLTDFSANSIDNHHFVYWKTATETNNSHFDIQRSIDSKTWENIGQVQGKGTTTQVQAYSFEDRKPLLGNNYYRLKQVDFDDTFSYSPIILVKNAIPTIKVFPNPGVDYVEIQLPSSRIEQVNTILFTDLSGKVFNRTKTNTQSTRIDISTFPTGIYLVSVYASDKSLISSHQVSKQ